MRRIALWLLPILLLTGGSLPAQEKTAATRGLEGRIEVLERKVKAISDLVLRMERLQREVQQLRGELEEQAHTMEGMRKRQRELYLDIDRRLGQATAKQQGSGPPEQSVVPRETPPPAATEPGPGSPGKPAGGQAAVDRPIPAMAASPQEEKAYRKAFELLGQRRYEEARKRFKAFLENYPDGFYADNAQYWLAESSYVTRDFDTALTEFTKVLKQYPDSPKVPGAMLKIGYIQYEKRQLAEARQTLETLVDRFPGSSAARLATSFIRKKGL